MNLESLDPELIRRAVQAALDEDRAFEDATSLATVTPSLVGTARLLAKQDGVLAGLRVFETAFVLVNPSASVLPIASDGERFLTGDVLAEVTGPVRGLLQAERVALNFLQRLAGTATLTRAFVDAVEGTKAVILDTRKTTPGMRDFEKYAVRCGGGTNHRRDLAVMAMIKDNHREALARAELSLADGVRSIRERTPGIPVEVEIDSVDQLQAALEARPEWVLLDNMSNEEMHRAVELTRGRAKLEASGGITLETVRSIAETGVDAVSVGALTHSAKALDLSLELEF